MKTSWHLLLKQGKTGFFVVLFFFQCVQSFAQFTNSICSGTTLNIKNPSAPSSSTYTWPAPVVFPAAADVDGAEASNGPRNSVNSTLINNTTGNTIVSYTVTCSDPDFNFTLDITVKPTPKVQASLATESICSGTSFVFNASSATSGTTVSWSRSPATGITPASGNSPGVSINEILTNTDPVQRTTLYSISLSANGCNNTQNKSVIVLPKPVLSSTLTPLDICSGTSFSYTPVSAQISSPGTFTWRRSAVPGITNPATTGTDNPNEILVNNTLAPVSVNYVYTLVSGTMPACSNTQTVSVNVNPVPQLTSAKTDAVCGGSNYAYSPISSLGPGTVFNWNRAFAANINPSGNSGTGNINEVLTNLSNSNVDVVYVYQLRFGGCSSSENLRLTVKPQPQLISGLTPAPICSNSQSFNYIPSSNQDPNVTFAWTRAAVAGISNAARNGLNNPNEILNNTTSAPVATVLVIYKYTLTNTNSGCSNEQNVSVNVNPIPTINNHLATVCNNNGFFYAPPEAPVGTTYTWIQPTEVAPGGALTNTLSAQSTDQPVIHELIYRNGSAANTTVHYQVKPKLGACIGADFTIDVTVKPGNDANIDMQSAVSPPAVCSGTPFIYTPNSNAPGRTFDWIRLAVQGISNPGNADANINTINETLMNTANVPVTVNYYITVKSAGCSNTHKVNVLVNPTPVLSSFRTPAAVCSNQPFTYHPTSATNDVPLAQFAWTRATLPGISNPAQGGNGDINENLVNTTANPLEVTYTYQMTSSATPSCVATQDVKVFINPIPKLSGSHVLTPICSGSLATYNAISNTAGTIFNWTRDVAANIDNGASAGFNPISEQLNNNSLAPAVATYKIQLTANGCTNAESVTVTVSPIPSVSNRLTDICSGSGFTISPMGVVSNIRYTWASPTSIPAGIVTGGNGASMQTSISEAALQNTSTSNAIASYTVVPAANGCTGASFSVDITVKPAPVVTNFTLPAVCSGSPFVYTPPSVPTGTVYSWPNPAINPLGTITGWSAQNTQNTISQILSVNDGNTNNAIYTITPAANGCTGMAFQLTVPVKPIPVANDQATPVCSGNTFSVNPGPVPAGTTFTWALPVQTPASSVNGADGQASQVSLISQTLTSISTDPVIIKYTVVPSTAGCPGNTFSLTVTVNPSTQLSSPLTPPDICSNTLFSYSPTSNTPSTNSFAWQRSVVPGISNTAASGAGNPNETLINNSNLPLSVIYTYTLGTTAGCSRTENVTVVINPTPKISSTLTPTAICSGAVFSYTATSSVAGVGFNWSRAAVAGITTAPNSGTGNVNESLNNSSINTVTVTYLYTATANGCASSSNVILNVKPMPVTGTKAASICHNTAFTISPTGVPANTLYSWAAPVSNPAGVISGGSTQSNQTNISGVLNNPTISSATATYNVTPNADGCTGPDFRVEITVKPVPVITDISLPSVCSGNPFSYSPGNVPTGTQYSWNGPIIQPTGGLSGGSPQFFQSSISQTLSSSNNIANTAVYTVSPIADGCPGGSFQLTVPVNPTPVIASSAISICSGNTFLVSPAPVPSGTMYTWDTPVQSPPGFVTGAVAQNTQVANISQHLVSTNTSEMQVNYHVIPITGTCQGNIFSVTVTVNPATQLSSSLNPGSICSNETFTYMPLSNTPSTVQYNWQRAMIAGIQNATATGSGNPNEQLDNTTSSVINVTYQYTLITSAGCSKTENVIVPVKPTPVLSTPTTVHTICSGQTFIYTPESAVSGTVFTWARPSSPPITTGASSGSNGINETLTNPSGNTAQAVYRYSLTANGCSNTQNIPVNVKPVPVITNQSASICSDNSFSVVPAAPAGTIFGWPMPISSPSGAVTGGTAQSLQTSVSQALKNATIAVGTLTYHVTPELNGCSGPDFTVLVTVKPIPAVSDISIPSTCSGVSFTYIPANVPAGTEYSWEFPVVDPVNGLTGGTAEALKPSLKQVLNSSNNVVNKAEYTVTPSANGCTGNPFKVRISINPVPLVPDQNISICSESSFTVSPQSVPVGTTYTWPATSQSPFGSVDGSSAQEIPVTTISQFLRNNINSQASVTYSVTPQSGSCTGTRFSILVAVNPSTRLSSDLTPDPICSKDVFNYTPQSATAGTSFRWERGATSGISNPAAVGKGNPFESLVNITNDPVTVTYKYILSTQEGCNNTQTVLVQVKPIPAMSSPLQTGAICSGTRFHYNPSSTVSGTSFTWTRDPAVYITNNPASGTDDPAEILINSGILTVHVPYTYRLNANGCGSTETVIVPVKPTPTAYNASINTCSKAAFEYKAPNVPTTTLYTWTAPPVSSPSGAIMGGSAQMNQESIIDVLENKTLFTNNAKYTISPSAEGCKGSPFNLTVFVFPSASIADQSLAPICSGTTINFTADNVPNGTRYTWSAPKLNADNSLTGGYEETISKTSVTQTLSSSNNIWNTAEYIVKPVTSNCPGNAFKLLITVKPVPVLDDLFDTVCTKLPIVVAPKSVPLNTIYTWQSPSILPVGSISGATAQNSPVSSFRQTLTSRAQSPANAIYSVHPEADGCKGNDFRLTITVGPGIAPVADRAVTVCSGIAFDATPKNQLPNTYYSWQPPVVSPALAIVGAEEAGFRSTTISQQLTNTTINNATATYTVRAHNTGCTSNSFLATVTVLPIPQVSISGKMEICRYPFDTLTLNFVGTAPWGFTYRNNNTDNVISGIKTSQYKLAVPSSPTASRQLSFYDIMHSGTCINDRDTSFFEQIIHSLPEGTLHSLHGQYICNGLADTLFVTVPEPVSYQWTKNNEPIIGATDDTLITNIEGRYNVTLVNNKGCIDTAAAMQPLINIVQPQIRFKYDSHCINRLMSFTNITDTNLTGPTTWLWAFDNGETRTTFHSSTTFNTGGDHHIKLSAQQLFCPAVSTSFDSTVNIHFPIAGLTMPSVWAYKGLSTPIQVRSLPDYKYSWKPPFGIHRPDSANTFFNLQNTQQYLIDLISPAGCVSQDSVLVRVYEDKLVNIFVPKSFSPNGDGINDKLYPFLTGIREFKYFKVYNRLNQLMYETTNHDAGWNGMKNGTVQPMGIYIWEATGIATDGSVVKKMGQVLLLR